MYVFLLSVALISQPREPHPPGRLVDIGGRHLHLHCSGQGQPTVVVETGLGDFSFDWVFVQRGLSKITRTCTYDRAGYAWSDPGPEARTFAQLNAEIRRALSRAGERAPFVLVGHSFGGGVVRAWTLQYPNEVAGLVLVDAVSEHQYVAMGPHAGRIGDDAKGRSIPAPTDDLMRRAAPVAIDPSKRESIEPPYDRLPKTERDLHAWASAQPSVEIAENSQREWSAEYAARWAATSQQGSLGSTPLIVLTRAHGGYGDNLDKPAAELERLRLTAQRSLALLSSQGSQRVVESGHNMHIEAPDVVISAVLDVVKVARH
jgi:pimeloyl-ACP methyl ester carboxylesterase